MTRDTLPFSVRHPQPCIGQPDIEVNQLTGRGLHLRLPDSYRDCRVAFFDQFPNVFSVGPCNSRLPGRPSSADCAIPLARQSGSRRGCLSQDTGDQIGRVWNLRFLPRHLRRELDGGVSLDSLLEYVDRAVTSATDNKIPALYGWPAVEMMDWCLTAG
jgi:hypothetical protein